MATEGTGDLVGSTAVSARKQDLAAAQNEGFRRAQTRLQGLTLVVREWTHEYGLFHEHRINSCLPSRLRMHYGKGLCGGLRWPQPHRPGQERGEAARAG